MKPSQQTAIIQRLVMEGINKKAEEIRTQTAQQVFAVTLLVLHDKYSFTPAQLVTAFEDIVKQFECINGKYVKIEEFYSLLDGMGIKVR